MESVRTDREKTWYVETYPRRKICREQRYDQGMRVKLEQQYFLDEELTTKAHITPFNADIFP